MRGTVLGLDPALTRSGWAIITGPPPVAVVEYGSKAVNNLPDFIAWLRYLLDAHKPMMVCYEQPLQVIVQYGRKQLIPGQERFTAPNASQVVLWKIEGVIEALAAERDIPALSVPVRTWRSGVLGDGKMSRAEAKAAAKQFCHRLGLEKVSEDAAEAVCVGIYGASGQVFRYHLLGSRGT